MITPRRLWTEETVVFKIRWSRITYPRNYRAADYGDGSVVVFFTTCNIVQKHDDAGGTGTVGSPCHARYPRERLVAQQHRRGKESQ